jgi:hypothetical protein
MLAGHLPVLRLISIDPHTVLSSLVLSLLLILSAGVSILDIPFVVSI